MVLPNKFMLIKIELVSSLPCLVLDCYLPDDQWVVTDQASMSLCQHEYPSPMPDFIPLISLT